MSRIQKKGSAVATRTVITLVDDLTGKETGEDGRRVAFSFDGIDYHIDLGEKSLAKLEKALTPFIAAATRVGGRPVRRQTGTADTPNDSRRVRDWARSNGFTVSDRGRVPASVVAAYAASH